MPLIKPSLIVITMLLAIWDFNVFNQIWPVSQGGPRETTATIGIFTYKKAFVSFGIGTGAAASVLVTLIPLALTSVYIRYLLKSVEDLRPRIGQPQTTASGPSPYNGPDAAHAISGPNETQNNP